MRILHFSFCKCVSHSGTECGRFCCDKHQYSADVICDSGEVDCMHSWQCCWCIGDPKLGKLRELLKLAMQHKVRSQTKKRYYLGIFPKRRTPQPTLGQQWLLKQFCLNNPVEHIQRPKLPKLYVRVETSASYFVIHNQFVKYFSLLDQLFCSIFLKSPSRQQSYQIIDCKW